MQVGRSAAPAASRVGSIVVHAMLDYENLPFISSRTPYRESAAASRFWTRR